VRPLIAEAKALGVRVSLFMDADPEAMPLAKAVGADRVELYTEPYAPPGARPAAAAAAGALRRAGAAAQAAGLGVNAGHDLNRDNLADFVRAVPGVLEVSIGHAFIADALELGYAETTRQYLACLKRAQIRDLRHRHRHLRHPPHPRFAGPAWRTLRRQDPERGGAHHLARPQRPLAGRAACATWPPAFPPRRPSARPWAWACACP
jgi:hypothetical protein